MIEINQEFCKQKNASIHAFMHFPNKISLRLSSSSFTLNLQHRYNTRARAHQRMANQEQECARIRVELDDIKRGTTQMREMVQALTTKFEAL